MASCVIFCPDLWKWVCPVGVATASRGRGMLMEKRQERGERRKESLEVTNLDLGGGVQTTEVRGHEERGRG